MRQNIQPSVFVLPTIVYAPGLGLTNDHFHLFVFTLRPNFFWNQVGKNLHLKPPQQITPCGHNKSASAINEA